MGCDIVLHGVRHLLLAELRPRLNLSIGVPSVDLWPPPVALRVGPLPLLPLH